MATQKQLKAQITRQAKARETKVEAFSLSLEKFLRTNMRKILKDAAGGKLSAKKAAAYLGSLMDSLEEAGLQKQIQRIERIFADEVEDVREAFELSLDKELVLTASDLANADSLIEFQQDRIFSTVQNYTDDTKTVLLQSLISGTPPDLAELLDDSTDRLGSNIKTELNTAALSFNRAIHMAKAKDLGMDLFLYIGPDDKITRDFCRDVLEGQLEGFERDVPIYTSEEIERMDNGQDLPVSTTGGGFNCRHHWTAITPEFAEKMGYVD